MAFRPNTVTLCFPLTGHATAASLLIPVVSAVACGNILGPHTHLLARSRSQFAVEFCRPYARSNIWPSANENFSLDETQPLSW
jgi:hypothetical protein